MKLSVKKDIAIILIISFISAILYITLEGKIMDYGRDLSYPLLLRFLPVLLIQMGMSCLGVLIVLVKNKERLSDYGLKKKNAIISIFGCLVVAIPTVCFLWMTNDINGFLPFHGMIGFDAKTLLEALTTFILMYGSLIVREKSDNAWGNILIFFIIWNAL